MGAARFGLIGCGAIGKSISKAFRAGGIEGSLSCVLDINRENAEEASEMLEERPRVCESLEEVLMESDIIIEAASQEAVRQYLPGILRAGKPCIIMSVGALMEDEFRGDMMRLSRENDAMIIIPSGAIAGVDGVLAAAEGGIDEIALTTTKPPLGLAGVDYVRRKGIDLESITKPVIVFDGDAGTAAKHFPKNINVAAVISLAAQKNCKVRIIADPNTLKNTHEIMIRGAFGEINVKTTNQPSPDNPKTSHLAILSAQAAIKKTQKNIKTGN
jgi:aspartate dehydrogenase